MTVLTFGGCHVESCVAMGVLNVNIAACSLQVCNTGGMAPPGSVVQGGAAILRLHIHARWHLAENALCSM